MTGTPQAIASNAAKPNFLFEMVTKINQCNLKFINFITVSKRLLCLKYLILDISILLFFFSGPSPTIINLAGISVEFYEYLNNIWNSFYFSKITDVGNYLSFP
jgi:hypothetical protein